MMLRLRWRLAVALLFTTTLLTLFFYSVGIAAPQPQAAPSTDADGQEYVVKAGDWLSKISQDLLGSSAAFPRIVEATNAKAATDPRFARIDNPDVIEVGQRLWIPGAATAATVDVTPTAAMTATVAVTSTEALTEASPLTVSDVLTAGNAAAGEVITGSVRFVAPVAGVRVAPRFDIEMAAEGLIVEPAGEIHENAGHFHILVDSEFVTPGELVPFDASHLHFGQGQLTTTVELEPGVHNLRLQFANGAHLALAGAQYRDEITVTVTAGE